MTPEQRIYDKFVREVGRLLPKGEWRIVRIESSTGVGIPDCYFRYGSRVVCWIETKATSYRVTKEQWAWAYREQLAGGEVYVVTQGMDGALIVLGFDERMVGYSTLGKYIKEVRPLELSVGGWVFGVF